MLYKQWRWDGITGSLAERHGDDDEQSTGKADERPSGYRLDSQTLHQIHPDDRPGTLQVTSALLTFLLTKSCLFFSHDEQIRNSH